MPSLGAQPSALVRDQRSRSGRGHPTAPAPPPLTRWSRVSVMLLGTGPGRDRADEPPAKDDDVSSSGVPLPGRGGARLGTGGYTLRDQRSSIVGQRQPRDIPS